jgi:cytochrome c oxidase subunit 3
MLTGFHGFHVLIGAIMLTVVLLRILRVTSNRIITSHSRLPPWYWHFVDVVWIGLYIVVYWL